MDSLVLHCLGTAVDISIAILGIVLLRRFAVWFGVLLIGASVAGVIAGSFIMLAKLEVSHGLGLRSLLRAFSDQYYRIHLCHYLLMLAWLTVVAVAIRRRNNRSTTISENGPQ
jgi:hypothetical protein